MKFGNLEEALDNDKGIMAVIKENQQMINESYGMKMKKPSRWSNFLTSLSHYGMKYNDKVYQNMVSMPADPVLQDDDDKLMASLNQGFMSNWKIKPDEEKSFSEKTLNQKREILRKMAMQPELEDILDIMANESIVYNDDESYICNPYIDTALIQSLNEKSADELKNAIDSVFYKIYLLLDWKKHSWDIYKRYLIDGVLSYEIVYDDLENPKSIIGIIDIDPATLTKKIENGVTYWVQFKDDLARERKLTDAQIIYIKYEDSGVSERQSYLERLIRPFNIYRIVEQAQVIWTVTQSSFKTMFTIPVAGQNRTRGQQTLANSMNRYKEDITFNTETGDLKINGKVNMPFNKEYWFAENEHGKPTIETLVDNGPQLNDSDQIKYFESKLYRMSKIPQSRFDTEAQATWFGTDATAALRDEINFTRFVNRLRNNFAEICLKPLRIQVALQLPDIKNDKRILDSISLRFNSYNLFEEMMNIEVMTKRIEFIGTFKDSLVVTDSEGNETPYFSAQFLIEKYLKMSKADIELNEKYKLLEKKAKSKNGTQSDEDEGSDEEGGGDLLGGGSGDEESGSTEDSSNNEQPESDEGSGELDNEMMGDVQPESSETLQA